MARKSDWVDKGAAERTDFRIEMQLSIRYKIARKVQNTWQISSFFRGVGVDFSASGSAFIVAKELPEKYLVYLEMFFPFDRFPVSTVAEIVRVKPTSFKAKSVYRCMCKYLIISTTIQDKMVGYLNEVNREAKKG